MDYNNKQTNNFNNNYNLPNSTQFSSINFNNKNILGSDGFRKIFFLIIRKSGLEKFNK